MDCNTLHQQDNVVESICTDFELEICAKYSQPCVQMKLTQMDDCQSVADIEKKRKNCNQHTQCVSKFDCVASHTKRDSLRCLCKSCDVTCTFIDASKINDNSSAVSKYSEQYLDYKADVGVCAANCGCNNLEQNEGSTGSSCDVQDLCGVAQQLSPLLGRTTPRNGTWKAKQETDLKRVLNASWESSCGEFFPIARHGLCCRDTGEMSDDCIIVETLPQSESSFDISPGHVPTSVTSICTPELKDVTEMTSTKADLFTDISEFSGTGIQKINSVVVSSEMRFCDEISRDNQRTNDEDDVHAENQHVDEHQTCLLKSVQSHILGKDITTLVECCEERQRHLVDYIAANKDRPAAALDELAMYVQLISDTLAQVKMARYSKSLSRTIYNEQYTRILQLILDIEIPHSFDNAPLHDGPIIVLSEYFMPIFVFCLVAVMFMCY